MFCQIMDWNEYKWMKGKNYYKEWKHRNSEQKSANKLQSLWIENDLKD